MVKAYPQFRSSYTHEEMVEHFLLTPAELQLVLCGRNSIAQGALRAFRVIRPDELRPEHWFAAGATILRHTVEGCAVGKYEAIWRERIEPDHDLTLEALFDNVQAAATGPDSQTRM